MLDFPFRRRYGKAATGPSDLGRLHDLSARFWLGYNIVKRGKSVFIAACLGLPAGTARLSQAFPAIVNEEGE
jgi:hypothetical protein